GGVGGPGRGQAEGECPADGPGGVRVTGSTAGGLIPAARPRSLGRDNGTGGRRAMAEDRVPGLFAPQRRILTIGLVLTITFVASEALAVATVMPVVAHDLGGLRLYGWVFSGFMLGEVI